MKLPPINDRPSTSGSNSHPAKRNDATTQTKSSGRDSGEVGMRGRSTASGGSTLNRAQLARNRSSGVRPAAERFTSMRSTSSGYEVSKPTQAASGSASSRVNAFRQQVEEASRNSGAPSSSSPPPLSRPTRPTSAPTSRKEVQAAWESVLPGLSKRVDTVSDRNFKGFVEHYRQQNPIPLSEIPEVNYLGTGNQTAPAKTTLTEADFDAKLPKQDALFGEMSGMEREFSEFLIMRRMIGLKHVDPGNITRDEFILELKQIQTANKAASMVGNYGGVETELKHALLTTTDGSDLVILDKAVLAENRYLEIQVDHSAYAGNKSGKQAGEKKPIIELVLKPVNFDNPADLKRAVQLKEHIATEFKRFYTSPHGGSANTTRAFTGFISEVNRSLERSGIEHSSLRTPKSNRKLVASVALNKSHTINHKRWTTGRQLTTTIPLQAFNDVEALASRFPMSKDHKALLFSSHQKASNFVEHIFEQVNGRKPSTAEHDSMSDLIGWFTHPVMLVSIPNEGSDNVKNRLPFLQKSHPMDLFKKAIPKEQQTLVTDYIKTLPVEMDRFMVSEKDGTPKTLRPIIRSFAKACDISLEDRAADRGFFTPTKGGLLECILADADIAGSDRDRLGQFLGFYYIAPNQLSAEGHGGFASAYEVREPYRGDLVTQAKTGKFV